MLNRLTLIVVLVPLAIALVSLAVANRGLAAFTLDPFNPGNPHLTIEAPLFVFLFVAIGLGMITGSLATWFKQSHYRRAARQRSREAERLRAEVARSNTIQPLPSGPALPKP